MNQHCIAFICSFIHQWIGGLFLVGAFTHFAIAVVRIDWHTLVLDIFNVLSMNSDIILGHLSWVVTFLGINAFGLYVHNDTLLALNRIPDTFSDAAAFSLPWDQVSYWACKIVTATPSALNDALPGVGSTILKLL